MWIERESTQTKVGYRSSQLRERVKQLLSLLRGQRLSASELAEQGSDATQASFPERVRDVGDVLWDVRKARATKHGFSLYFGRPTEEDTSRYVTHPRLIVTKELEDYWQAIRATGHGSLYDLPASTNVLQRARRKLGFHYYRDVNAFWTAQREDLESLSPRELVAKYGVSSAKAQAWRLKVVGRLIRPNGWWRAPEICEILLSDEPIRQVGEKLGVTKHYACQLRCRAKQAFR